MNPVQRRGTQKRSTSSPAKKRRNKKQWLKRSKRWLSEVSKALWLYLTKHPNTEVFLILFLKKILEDFLS